MSERRWNPVLGEWVITATHRQDRTFLPPARYNPLRPSDDPSMPTELPEGRYDVAVFDNLFPALSPAATDAPELHVPSLPARGRCEVVVFTQDSEATVGGLPPIARRPRSIPGCGGAAARRWR